MELQRDTEKIPFEEYLTSGTQKGFRDLTHIKPGFTIYGEKVSVYIKMDALTNTLDIYTLLNQILGV